MGSLSSNKARSYGAKEFFLPQFVIRFTKSLKIRPIYLSYNKGRLYND